MHLDNDGIATQLAALGYIPPGVGSQRSFWGEYGVAVIVGVVVLALYVAVVVAEYHATDRLPGDGDR